MKPKWQTETGTIEY